ncbi:MAG: hypothetical protein JKY65_28095 [Planctomycetes bacterium]|nr:hypothetical protein [Planctomycetota bacterium]
MSQDDRAELLELIELLEAGSQGPSLSLSLLGLCARQLSGGTFSAELRERAKAVLLPALGESAALAAGRYERSLAAAEAGVGDPFFADDNEAQRLVIEVLEARDRLQQGNDACRALELDAGEGFVLLGEEEERLSSLLDRALPANPLRREEAPASKLGWWWTYRLDCDENLLAQARSEALTPRLAKSLEEHLRGCPFCALELEAEADVDKLLSEELKDRPACPAPEELDALSRGNLPPHQARGLADHVELCAECRAALRAAPRARRREPAGVIRLGALIAAQLELVRFASAGPALALAPLEGLHRVTRMDSTSQEPLEIGVVHRSGDVQLVVWAPGLERVRVFDLEAGSLDPAQSDPVATLTAREGLFRLSLASGTGGGSMLLDLGELGTRVVDPEIVHLWAEPCDRAVVEAKQALALGSPALAEELLRVYASKLVPGLRRSLAEAAVRDLGIERRRATHLPTRGSVDTLVAWGGKGGLVRVSALTSDDRETPGQGAELCSALRLGGEVGLSFANKVRPIERKRFSKPVLELDLEGSELRGAGASVGLAAALARYSALLELDLPAGLLVTGVLVGASGRLEAVDGRVLPEKLRAAARERGRARVILPARNEADVPADMASTLDLSFATDFAQALDLAFGPEHRSDCQDDSIAGLRTRAKEAERSYRWKEAIELAEHLLVHPEAQDGDRLSAHWIVGICRTHQARPTEAASAFAVARTLRERLEANFQLDHVDAVYLAMGRADHLADLFRLEEAIDEVEAGLKLAPNLALRAKAFGLRGLFLHYADRQAEALESLQQASQALEGAPGGGDPQDRSRFFCWRALVLVAQNEFTEAGVALEAGLALSEEIQDERGRSANRVYLYRTRARLEAARGCWEESWTAAKLALEVLADSSGYPASSLRRLAGRALLELGRVEEGGAELKAGAERSPTPGSALNSLLSALPLAEHAAWLLETGTSPERAAEVLAEVRARLDAYAPAQERFSAELAALAEPGDPALKALRRILAALPY